MHLFDNIYCNDNNNNNNDNESRRCSQFRSMTMAPAQRESVVLEETKFQTTLTKHTVSSTPLGSTNGTDATVRNVNYNNNNPPAAASIPSCWAPLSQLTRLPLYHALPDNGYTTFPRHWLPAVMDKVNRTLYQLNCAIVAYDTHKLVAQCSGMMMGQSQGSIEFQVAFFASRNSHNNSCNKDHDENDDTVILELQHTAGDARTFYQTYAQALLPIPNTLTTDNKNKTDDDDDNDDDDCDMMEADNVTTKSGKTSCGHVLDLLWETATETSHNNQQLYIQHAVDTAKQMIMGNHNHIHQRDNGFHGLANLLDPTQSGYHTAMQAAYMIVQDTTCMDVILPEISNSMTALAVLSRLYQVLAAASKDQDNSSNNDTIPPVPDQLVSRLVQIVQQQQHHHHQDAHHATLALQTLSALHQLQIIMVLPPQQGAIMVPPLQYAHAAHATAWQQWTHTVVAQA